MPRFWRFFLILCGVAFVLVNLYVSWLATTLVPFQEPTDLSSAGTKISREVSGFGWDRYVCGIALLLPDRGGGFGEMWDEWTNRVKLDLDARVRIRIVDSRGVEKLSHEGRLSEWTMTNSSQVNGQNVTVYVDEPRFDASALRTYVMTMTVLEPARRPSEYQPTFTMEGGDPGYFPLVRPVLNLALAALLGALAVVAGLVRRMLRRQNRTSATSPSAP